MASTPLDEQTKTTLDNLGPVRFIVGADAVHHLYLAQYKKEYPSAILIAPEAVRARLVDKSLKFDGAWGRDPPGTKYGFEDDIKSCYFGGYKNKDIAFFHEESKTLIEADLLFNFPCTEQYSKAKSGSGRLFLEINPWSRLHSWILWCMSVDMKAMKRDARIVASWDFERVIPCHGDVIEGKGKDAWINAYKSYLQD